MPEAPSPPTGRQRAGQARGPAAAGWRRSIGSGCSAWSSLHGQHVAVLGAEPQVQVGVFVERGEGLVVRGRLDGRVGQGQRGQRVGGGGAGVHAGLAQADGQREHGHAGRGKPPATGATRPRRCPGGVPAAYAQRVQGGWRNLVDRLRVQRPHGPVEIVMPHVVHRKSSNRFCSAPRARDRCVLTEPSLQPMTRAVVATSSSSSTRRLNASRWRRGRSRSAATTSPQASWPSWARAGSGPASAHSTPASWRSSAEVIQPRRRVRRRCASMMRLRRMVQNSGVHSSGGRPRYPSIFTIASCTTSSASSRWRSPASAKRKARAARPSRKASRVSGSRPAVAGDAGAGAAASAGMVSSIATPWAPRCTCACPSMPPASGGSGEDNARGGTPLTAAVAAVAGAVMIGVGSPGRVRVADGFVALYIFMLAAIAGHVIISRVPVILHTPLMSGSNFIHGAVLIGAMVVLGHADTTLEKAVGFVAVLMGAGNAAGGYVVTERMLDMFKPSDKAKAGDKGGGA